MCKEMVILSTLYSINNTFYKYFIILFMRSECSMICFRLLFLTHCKEIFSLVNVYSVLLSSSLLESLSMIQLVWSHNLTLVLRCPRQNHKQMIVFWLNAWEMFLCLNIFLYFVVVFGFIFPFCFFSFFLIFY